MKCTWNKCGKETDKDCPLMWTKHIKFNPIVLRAFFDGIPGEEHLDKLDAFVCQEHMKEYKAYVNRSNQAKKRKKKVEDFSI